MKRGTVVGLVVVALATFGLARSARAAPTAPAGGRWVRVDAATQDFGPGTRMTSVVAFQRKLFATGMVTDAGHEPFPIGSAMWTSPDGRRWERVDPWPFAGAREVELSSTSAALYAVSPGQQGTSPRPSTVWRSTDGRTWQLLTADAPAALGRVVAAPAGLVAVGSDVAPNCGLVFDCIRTAIWFSTDGVKWARVAGDDPRSPGSFAMGVVRTSNGLVAVANPQHGTKNASEQIWTSRRGVQWDATPSRSLNRAKASLLAIAASSRTALAVGVVPSGVTVPSTTTTTSPPTTVRNADGSVSGTVTLCATIEGAPAVWTRSGGADWVRAGVRGMGQAVPISVVASRGHWIGVADAGDCSSSRPVLLTSTDARRWHREVADAPSGAAPPPHRQPTALAATPTGAIAFVGSFPASADGPEVWLWTAPK